MKRYKKDKKITILARQEYENAAGETSTKVMPLPNGENIWAYYRQASTSELAMVAQTKLIQVDVIFKVNWRDDLDTTMEILFRNEKYEITRIDDFEGYKNDLTIYATRKQ